MFVCCMYDGVAGGENCLLSCRSLHRDYTGLRHHKRLAGGDRRPAGRGQWDNWRLLRDLNVNDSFVAGAFLLSRNVARRRAAARVEGGEFVARVVVGDKLG